MHHDQYREQLHLLIYEEMEPDEKRLLEIHLTGCEKCRAELANLQKLHTLLGSRRVEVGGSELLTQARRALHATLQTIPPSPWRSLTGRIRSLFPDYRIAFAAAAMLAVGLFAGYLAFSPSRSLQPPIAQEPSLQEYRVSGLRFIDADASDGEVEIVFDAVRQTRLKGRVDDERIQRVLAHALINDQNPGVRLRTVNAFGARALKLPDRELRAALISALKSDPNPGVRQEALRVLRSFHIDDEIKDAFLHVLMHDTNAGLRIAAINGLDSARMVTAGSDNDLLKVLQESMNSDQNNYVRLRARAFLQEVKDQ